MIDFKSFVWGLISCAVYDFIKSLYQKRGTHYHKYSKEYISKVKTEFYLGVSLTAFFILLPNFGYDFLDTIFDTLSIVCLVFAIFGFMCVIEVLNYIQNKSKEENTDKD